ncbi:hypothetical protein NK6_7806 [Bradyrhizobium diazoefficiens]|uniref:Uncharacterized protein n=1 Tax=Bradyrhizobium diazoefficiens TaxID=1355477 RepID=A0A0E4BVI0_9BRAD|nr:hypothetical protein NK6_7806 [Bradyrhizobium diazoefficiens]
MPALGQPLSFAEGVVPSAILSGSIKTGFALLAFDR